MEFISGVKKIYSLMKLYIKYMVSQRCKALVERELMNLGLHNLRIELGLVEILEEISPEQKKRLKETLQKSGLELLDDKRSCLVESIKRVIIEMIHQSEEDHHLTHSTYISEKLGYDYTYLANVFSEVKGMTIQQYIILNRIEKVKELLLYNELTLTEISYQLHYSSVAHLSNQFKKVTGLTPSFYRGIADKKRMNLEDV